MFNFVTRSKFYSIRLITYLCFLRISSFPLLKKRTILDLVSIQEHKPVLTKVILH